MSGAPAPGAAPPPGAPERARAEGDGGEGQLPVLDPVHGQYEKLHRIGEGTYGVVYKARHVPSGRIVALKKVRFERSREGVPVTSVRELRVLQQCRHPNIVHLERVVTGSRADSVFLVFEYADHDLGRLLDSMPNPFTESEVKCLVRQLLTSVAYLHSRGVLHRDIKLSNLLYTSDGALKLCDFGLARHCVARGGRLTPRVVTLWYRAPELLLGSDTYDEAIDCWAVGCVLGELLRHEPLFPAQTEAECVAMHAQLLGAPSPRIWPGMASLPGAASLRLPTQPYNHLRRAFPALGDAGLSLLNGLLTYDPERRLTAAAALRHPYFSERPLPKPQRDMPSFPSSHDVPGAYKGVLQARGPRASAGGGVQQQQQQQQQQHDQQQPHHHQQQQQQQQQQPFGGSAWRPAPAAAGGGARGADAGAGRWGEVFGAAGGGGGGSAPMRKRPRAADFY